MRTSLLLIHVCFQILCFPLSFLKPTDNPQNRPTRGIDKVPDKPKRNVVPNLLVVTVTSKKRVYKYLEPIVVDVALKNVSKKRLQISICENNKYMSPEFDVLDQLSNPIPKSRFLKSQGLMWGRPFLVLNPGEEIHKTYCVNLMYDMSAAGPYTIVVSVPFHISDQPFLPQRIFASSKSLSLTVGGGLDEIEKQNKHE